ncbi:MAG TPA: nucleoside deaminase [Xanthobacteraceae bacterium]|jgi:tRNA(adenine34) deaminase|nr:nucleoside deaminase [Xanthobacteraceae bacterium]
MACHDHCTSTAKISTLDRRSVITALASTAVLSTAVLSAPDARAEAGASTASAEDIRYMHLALDEARRGDYPFGAVIVKDGKILARGRNLGRTHDDPTAHGEMVAIRRCLSAHGSAALKGATLYTSGEPCVMCMGAIIWCGVGRLIYAASVEQIAAKMNQIMISSSDVAAKAPFNPIKITGGVLADEAVPLLAR